MTNSLTTDIGAAGRRALQWLGTIHRPGASAAYADVLAVVNDRNRLIADQLERDRDHARIAGQLRIIDAADAVREAHIQKLDKAEQYRRLEALFDIITVPPADPRKKRK